MAAPGPGMGGRAPAAALPVGAAPVVAVASAVAPVAVAASAVAPAGVRPPPVCGVAPADGVVLPSADPGGAVATSRSSSRPSSPPTRRRTRPVPDFEVIVERGSTPRELGPKLNRSAGDVIRFLFLQGEVVTAAQSLSDDMIELFAAEIGAQIRLVDRGEEQEAELQAKYFEEEEEEREEDLRPRPPVVTVMGHVDHGKTLLLDRIRHANVVAGEAGGITQHIGAYQTEAGGHRITFIDTPGHQAFTAMRARGAEVTDIVVLVVAADDGVMPQTVEAIDHARAADVPIVVALNKIDRDDADVNRVLQQLSEQGLTPEAWGGDTIVVQVSALQSQGIDDLLEQLAVVAELEELQASPEARARGVVLEANLESGRGPWRRSSSRAARSGWATRSWPARRGAR